MQISHRIMTLMMALALFMAIGGPLALLQGVAWVGTVSYTHLTLPTILRV